MQDIQTLNPQEIEEIGGGGLIQQFCDWLAQKEQNAINNVLHQD